ncbi:hypothetical protein O3P69_008453 [Scylla paramamosain]|uniref:Uncharacterized protein n=1 Tax=Scylla paramamosain TaxID=85552 RepID=A0AAW0SJY9_SCYPA
MLRKVYIQTRLWLVAGSVKSSLKKPATSSSAKTTRDPSTYRQKVKFLTGSCEVTASISIHLGPPGPADLKCLTQASEFYTM